MPTPPAVQSLRNRADTLRALHTNGELLVLPNIWNPIGARVLAAKGYPAVATASAALAASLGYADGERIKRETLIDFLGRIARSVDVPVTADIEAGYGESMTDLEETVRQVIEAGVVGINLEDSRGHDHDLRPLDEQCRRIRAVRRAADKCGVPLVINARVDTFMAAKIQSGATPVAESVTRASAYSEAGADCIYPIGPGDEATVRALREKIAQPLNILAKPGAAPVSILRAIGVNRVSFGPFVFRSCLRTFVNIADSLKGDDGYACLAEMVSFDEAAKFLGDERE
jgi:2-methylisocitrate lyase-like PEP mutase family enzyme